MSNEIETIFSELLEELDILVEKCVGSDETAHLTKDVISLKSKCQLGKKLSSEIIFCES